MTLSLGISWTQQRLGTRPIRSRACDVPTDRTTKGGSIDAVTVFLEMVTGALALLPFIPLAAIRGVLAGDFNGAGKIETEQRIISPRCLPKNLLTLDAANT